MSGTAGFTLGDLVSTNAWRFPDIVAYQDVRRSVTHAELHRRASRLVSAMARTGVGRQDRIVLLGRNTVEFCEVLAAGQLGGVVVVTPNWRWSETEVCEAIQRVSPTIVFCDDEYVATVSGASADYRMISFGADFEAFLATGADELPFAAHPDDIALLLFTSGTTGGAKCCIEGQREFHDILRTMNGEMRTGSADKVMISMPMCHIGALAIAGGIHANGGTVVLQQQFDAAEALRLSRSEQITVLHLAPVMLQRLLEEPEVGPALSSVRIIVYAAAPITRSLLQRALELLPQAGLVNMYGQTEAIVSGLPPELHTAEAADALGSVGFPFPGVRVRIVDEDGRDVVNGGVGEIVVHTDTQFRGYWDDQAATLSAVRDGWYHTGDIGRFDERGLLHLVDRKKDVIITGGENVYSPEVEDALDAIPGVLECAVVAVPDERLGETVCAVVVPDGYADLTLRWLQDGVSKTLARYKIPRRLVLCTELPRLGSGKADKKRLRQMLADGTLSQVGPG